MNICIYPPPDEQSGGPKSFATRLTEYWKSVDINVQSKIGKSTDVALVFVRAPFLLLILAKLLRVPVVLRLDGLYYPKKSGWLNKEYLRINLKVFLIRKYFCNAIIYQSIYSYTMNQKLLGKSSKKYKIIYNGILKKTHQYQFLEQQKEYVKYRFIVAGNFRGIDMLPTTVKVMDDLVKEFSFELHVFGSVDKDSQQFLERDYIVYHGKINSHDLFELLPQYDALLFTQLCPSCPNIVVEAGAAGIPVISFDTGAVSELVHCNRDLIANTSGKVLQGMKDWDLNEFKKSVLRFVNDPAKFQQNARNSVKIANNETCFLEYSNFIQEIRDISRKKKINENRIVNWIKLRFRLFRR